MSLRGRAAPGQPTRKEGSPVTSPSAPTRPQQARRRSLRWASAAVVVAAAAVGTAVFAQAPHGFATTTDQPLTTFADRESNVSMRLQLDPGSANYGAVLLIVPGQGVLWTERGLTVTKHSDTDTQLRYDGDALVDPAATADTEFHVNYQPSGQISTTHLRVVGAVDPLHHTSAVELFIGSMHYNLKTTSVAPATAQPVIDTLLKQLAAADWASIYTAADTSLKSAINQADFISQMNSELGTQKISSVQQTGPATQSTTAADVVYTTAPIAFTISTPSGTQTANMKLELILEGQTWRLLTLSGAA